MAVVSVVAPFETFFEVDGSPLESGFISIGTAGFNPLTNPIQIYSDVGLTIPVAQPVRTIGGYPVASGTPIRLYASASDYSMLVRDKNGSLVYVSLSNQFKFGSISWLNISYDQTAAEAAALVTPTNLYYPPGHAKRYGAVGDGITDDTAALLRMIAAMPASGGQIYFDDGAVYRINNQTLNGLNFSAKTNFKIFGNNATIKVLNAEPVVGGFGSLYFTNSQDGYIENLVIDGNRANRTPVEAGAFNINIQNSCARLFFKNVRSINAVIDGWTLTTSVPGTLSTYPTDITLQDCSADNAFRVGLSIIGSLRCKVLGGTYTNTTGTAPQNGIDVEPDVGYTFGNTDLLIENVMVYGNVSGGIVVTGPNASPNTRVTIAGVRAAGNGNTGIQIAQAQGVVVRDCEFGDPTVGNASLGILHAGDNTGNVSDVYFANNKFRSMTSAGLSSAGLFVTSTVGLPIMIDGVDMNVTACPAIRVDKLSVMENVQISNITATQPAVTIIAAQAVLRNIHMDTITGSPMYVTGADCEIDGATIIDMGASATAAIQFEAGSTGSIVRNINLRQRTAIPGGAVGIRYNGVAPRLIREVSGKSAGADFTAANIISFLSGTAGAYISDVQPDPLRVTGTWNPPSIAVGSSATTTFAIPACTLLDPAKATLDSSLAGLTLTAYVSVAGTVTLVLSNNTAGAVDLANSNVVVWVEKR